ncbi:hypothetical protein PVK06_027652 [Gossypium arboreum]|uniref:Reverse transcriptase n=1 Tax=Gossypium arboreum TaxID=29729 RepID=A0ABR0P3Y6_GOSAR|nr:hypothetical protein PVK06_027652 [Gossypium arboreum]
MRLAMQRSALRGVKATKGILEKGLCWRIGAGNRISVWDDLWILGDENDRLQNENVNENIKLISVLIDANNRKWNTDLVLSTFNEDTAKIILQIPLAKTIYEDFQGNNDQCHLFCCGLWSIWNHRNKFIYERKNTTGRDISKQVISFIAELNGAEEKRILTSIDRGHKQMERNMRMTIYFDTAFDKRTSRSSLGLVVCDTEGDIVASKSVIHSNISSPFAVEAYAENENAHLVAKEAMRRGEGHYLLGLHPRSIHQERERRRPRAQDEGDSRLPSF